jgi:surfactin synthase thioesterase subunit
MTKTVLRVTRWIRELAYTDSPSAARLLCFPHAGGSASFFGPTAVALAPDITVSAVQYPGRQDRRHEPAERSIAELADRIADVLPGWLVDRPAAFFGHSLGAVLAFEVALRLERDIGFRPTMLFASGRRAPSQIRAERVHLLDDAGVLRELRALSGTAPDFLADEELQQLILPALRADYHAIETYAGSHERLHCPVTVLAGERDPLATLAEVHAWSRHTTEELTVQVFPGGHFFINECPTEVLTAVRSRLRTAPPSPDQ